MVMTMIMMMPYTSFIFSILYLQYGEKAALKVLHYLGLES